MRPREGHDLGVTHEAQLDQRFLEADAPVDRPVERLLVFAVRQATLPHEEEAEVLFLKGRGHVDGEAVRDRDRRRVVAAGEAQGAAAAVHERLHQRAGNARHPLRGFVVGGRRSRRAVQRADEPRSGGAPKEERLRFVRELIDVERLGDELVAVHGDAQLDRVGG